MLHLDSEAQHIKTCARRTKLGVNSDFNKTARREEDRETFRRYLRKVQSKNFISSKLFHNYKGYGKTL